MRSSDSIGPGFDGVVRPARRPAAPGLRARALRVRALLALTALLLAFAAVAAQLVKFKDVSVLGGKISFSPKLHTVFGRTYRVIKIQNNKAKLVGTVTAKVVPKL